MKKLIWIFLVGFSHVSFAQGGNADPSSLDTVGRVISIETTECRGFCPVQSMSVYASGRVRYVGEANTQRKGTYEMRLTKSELNRLRTKFRTAQFFQFKASYQARVTDLPTTYLTFADKGRTLTIMDYFGAPQAVKKLEQEVLALLKHKGWKPITGVATK